MRGVTGVYDMTPDARPMLGAVPGRPGLVLAAGFSANTVSLLASVQVGLPRAGRQGDDAEAHDVVTGRAEGRGHPRHRGRRFRRGMHRTREDTGRSRRRRVRQWPAQDRVGGDDAWQRNALDAAIAAGKPVGPLKKLGPARGNASSPGARPIRVCLVAPSLSILGGQAVAAHGRAQDGHEQGADRPGERRGGPRISPACR